MSLWVCEVARCRVGDGVPSSLLFFPFGKYSALLITAWVRGFSGGSERSQRLIPVAQWAGKILYDSCGQTSLSPGTNATWETYMHACLCNAHGGTSLCAQTVREMNDIRQCR